ncbi:MAG: hypothetical protein KIT73_10270 [Burkholderiales bacterium]|nr:hypothetical protein [Burkholderiales bacterium]
MSSISQQMLSNAASIDSCLATLDNLLKLHRQYGKARLAAVFAVAANPLPEAISNPGIGPLPNLVVARTTLYRADAEALEQVATAIVQRLYLMGIPDMVPVYFDQVRPAAEESASVAVAVQRSTQRIALHLGSEV